MTLCLPTIPLDNPWVLGGLIGYGLLAVAWLVFWAWLTHAMAVRPAR